jgi:hypothetical protein
VIGGFLAVLALPGIIGGWGLLAQKEWAMVLVIVVGILHLVLVNFPLWHRAGCYTLWALLRIDQMGSGLLLLVVVAHNKAS